MTSQLTKTLQAGVALVDNDALEVVVHDDLIVEEMVESKSWPHEHSQVQHGSDGGLETQRETQTTEQWTQVVVEVSWWHTLNIVQQWNSFDILIYEMILRFLIGK